MKVLIIIIIFLFQCFIGFSQISIKNVPDNGNLKEAKSLYHFLLAHPVDTSRDWMSKPDQLKFYDSVVNRFFDREAMLKEFDKMKLVNIQTQYVVLYGIDRLIEYVPADSIFIERKLKYYKKNPHDDNMNLDKLKNEFFAGFIIHDKFYPMVEMRLQESGKLLFLLPMIWFDDAEGKIVGDFLNRQIKI